MNWGLYNMFWLFSLWCSSIYASFDPSVCISVHLFVLPCGYPLVCPYLREQQIQLNGFLRNFIFNFPTPMTSHVIAKFVWGTTSRLWREVIFSNISHNIPYIFFYLLYIYFSHFALLYFQNFHNIVYNLVSSTAKLINK